MSFRTTPRILMCLITLAVFGSAAPSNAQTIDRSELINVDEQTKVKFTGISHDPAQGTSTTNIRVINISDTLIETPLILVIESISDESVTIANADGIITPDGAPYFDLTGQVSGDDLDPGETTNNRPLVFNNPNMIPVTVETSVFVHDVDPVESPLKLELLADPQGRKLIGVPDGLDLTVRAEGEKSVTVLLAQEPAGAGSLGVVEYELDGQTGATLLVTTSGGPDNIAIVRVKGVEPSAFQGDLDLTALIIPAPALSGSEPVHLRVTVIQLEVSPGACLINDAPVQKVAAVIPGLADLEIAYDCLVFRPGVDQHFDESETSLRLEIVPLDGPTVKTDINGTASFQVQAGAINQGQTWCSVHIVYSAEGDDVGQGPGVTFADEFTGGKNRWRIGGNNDTGSGSVNVAGSFNSVSLYGGEKALDLTDLTIRGRGFGYRFGHTYGSQVRNLRSVATGDMAVDWAFTYSDDRLFADNNNVVVFQSDLRTDVFSATDTPNVFDAPMEFYEQLRLNNQGDFELRDRSGTVKTYQGFDHADIPGRLIRIEDRNANFMTFHYRQIDPDEADDDDSDLKFVLSFVIDTMGREILYQYYAQLLDPDSPQMDEDGRVLTVHDTNPGALGRLARVIDFKGDMDFDGNAESEDFPGQVNNRTLSFDYDDEGNLISCTRPAVAATPNGNDFSVGKTFRYTYLREEDIPAEVTGFDRERLLHNLTSIEYPNESAVDLDPGNPQTLPTAPDTKREQLTYGMDPDDPATFDRVLTYSIGGTNGNDVPAGGTITYDYEIISLTAFTPDQPCLRITVTDRRGNVTEYIYSGLDTLLEKREFTRGFRNGEPEAFVSSNGFNLDKELTSFTLPEENPIDKTFNVDAPDRFQQGNVTRVVRTPDPARAPHTDQAKIENVYVYEPIYNRPCLIIYGRGADIDNNEFTPPIDDPAAGVRQISDPYDPAKTIDLRYAMVEFFDYQEPTETAADAPDDRFDIDGTGGQVNESPLIGIDPDVLTVEVWLVQELGLAEDATGLQTLRDRLSANLTKLALGDLNGDGIEGVRDEFGDALPTIAGNIIRIALGSPVLIDGSNQHALEQQIDSTDLIDESIDYIDGGTQEGAFGQRLQTVVTMRQYNLFGQLTRTISPEGNVTTYEYFPETDPDGDGHDTPEPRDGRTLAADTGGYLRETIVDDDRDYSDQDGFLSDAAFSNNNTNPDVTDISMSYTYDDVGNVVTSTDGRGIRSDYFVNELDQTVQIIRAADISAAADADPPDPLIDDPIGPLTAFGYITNTFYDFNNNVTSRAVEDRGDTSNTGGFVESATKYDILDNSIETTEEVDVDTTLATRYRYDANENQVFVIHPEGNAVSSVYDERDLMFQQTSGADERPEEGLFAAGDPTEFDRPGGASTEPSTTTYNYDKNQNIIEYVDADDTDGDPSNNSDIAGVGDVSRYTYDGFDRTRTVTDALGNSATYFYDPAGNVVRTISNGDPIDDVVGDGENSTLAVSESIHDSLSRVIATHSVLFETPDVSTVRTPILTDGPDMDDLAPYLADADADTADVPDALPGLDVIGRITSIAEYDRASRTTFSVEDDLDADRSDYDGVSRTIKSTDSTLSNGFDFGAFDPDDMAGNTAQQAYDDNSNVIEMLETDVTSIPDVDSEQFRTTYLYDSLDRLQTIADNLGQTHDSRYDSRSNLVASADAQGPVSGRTINRRGLGSDEAVTVNDFGNVARYFYDGLSRTSETQYILTALTEGDGEHIGASLQGIKDVGGAADIPTPDLDQSEDGLIDTYQAWDDNSQLLAQRDDDGNTTAYVYDNQNRMICEVRGLGHPDYTFTAFAAITCPTTGLVGDTGSFNVALRNGPPPAMDPPIDTEPDGTDINFTFDPDSNVILILDEAGNKFNCTFDALNRKKSCAIKRAPGFVGTTAQAWLYDGLTRNTFCIDDNVPIVDGDFAAEDDVTCSYVYDSLSRKIEETQQVGASASVNAISCDYDVEQGGIEFQCSATTYPDGRRVVSTFDTLDRLVSRADEGFEGDPIGVYSYFGARRVGTLTYQNGTRLTYIGQDAGQNADVGYDGNRRVINKRWEQFDALTPLGAGDLVVGFGHQFGSPLGEAPAYDRMNNKLIEEKLHSLDNSEVYSYDSLYRVVDFKRGALNAGKDNVQTFTALPDALQSQQWDLDGVHNWKSNTHTTNDLSETENRTHSDFNEINEVAGDPYGEAVPGVHEFDANGNLTNDNRRLLTWDALNRLRQGRRASDSALIGEYSYDCMGRRVRRVVTNGGLPENPDLDGATEYFYDNWQVVEEQDGSGIVTQQYVYGLYIDEALTLDRRNGGAITIAELNDHVGDARLFYHCNTQYSVFALTTEGGGPNPSGEIVEGYQFDAYGRHAVFSAGDNGAVDFGGDDDVAIANSSAVGNPYLFSARRFDSETGWYYYRTRYYDSIAGRFTQRDTAGIWRDSTNIGNGYAYVGNNPMVHSDPYGLAKTIKTRVYLSGVSFTRGAFFAWLVGTKSYLEFFGQCPKFHKPIITNLNRSVQFEWINVLRKRLKTATGKEKVGLQALLDESLRKKADGSLTDEVVLKPPVPQDCRGTKFTIEAHVTTIGADTAAKNLTTAQRQALANDLAKEYNKFGKSIDCDPCLKAAACAGAATNVVK